MPQELRNQVKEITLDIVLRMADMAEGRLGELTSVGARQHRGIAKRMYTCLLYTSMANSFKANIKTT